MNALARHSRAHTVALLLLTAGTGVIDAVSYLSLDKVFTGNMTGNVLFLGFAAAGTGGIPLLNNAVALAGFLVGAVIGGRVVGRGHADKVPLRTVVTLAVNAAVALLLTLYWALSGLSDHVEMLVVTGLLAMAMGSQVAAVKPIGNADITTVVVTSTLGNLARDSRLAGAPKGANKGWRHRLAAIVVMGVAAGLGALTIRLGGSHGGWLGLLLGALAMTAAAVVLALSRRRSAAPAASEESGVASAG